MSANVLESMCDGSQFHPSIKNKEARYNIRDCFKTKKSGMESSNIIKAERG